MAEDELKYCTQRRRRGFAVKILHYYPDNDTMIRQYINMLEENMGPDAENNATSNAAEARQLLRDSHYDLLHLHGCWQNTARGVVNTALQQDTRLVFSPHGQLEPWVVSNHYWKEKFPKRLLYQQRIVSRAYAVVIQGKMEEECMRRLGWNTRTVIIRNALITHSTSFYDMARQTLSVYRRVMDSNTYELMDDNTSRLLTLLLKAGICGNPRWLNEDAASILQTNEEGWRQLMCFAQQEQIYDTLQNGIRVLDIDVPDIDVSSSDCFLPDNYQPPTSIEQAIGMQYATENERLLATFKYLRKQALHRHLSLRHLVELDKELREHDTEENLLCDTLHNHRLFRFASRIMSLMEQLTAFDTGFMPMPSLNDRLTRRMLRHIENHLSIYS
jgi:hypothetical protein